LFDVAADMSAEHEALDFILCSSFCALRNPLEFFVRDWKCFI